MKMEEAASYSFLLLRHRPEGIDWLEKKNKQNLYNSDLRSPSKPPAPDPPEEGGWPLSPRDLLKLVNPSLTKPWKIVIFGARWTLQSESERPKMDPKCT